MKLSTTDMGGGTTNKEAEEKYAPEAKVVAATDFHSVEASSILVGSTNNICMKGNWNFDIKTTVIAGRPYKRLSLL